MTKKKIHYTPMQRDARRRHATIKSHSTRVEFRVDIYSRKGKLWTTNNQHVLSVNGHDFKLGEETLLLMMAGGYVNCPYQDCLYCLDYDEE